MPHSTAQLAESRPHSSGSSRYSSRASTPAPRTDLNLPIAACPDFMTVDGSVISAAVIQQTYMMFRQDLSPVVCEACPLDRIKFTGMVGISLLRRLCRLPNNLHHALDLNNIGIPTAMAVRAVIPLRQLGGSADPSFDLASPDGLSRDSWKTGSAETCGPACDRADWHMVAALR